MYSNRIPLIQSIIFQIIAYLFKYFFIFYKLVGSLQGYRRHKGPGSHTSSKSYIHKSKNFIGDKRDDKLKIPEPIDLYEAPIISDEEGNFFVFYIFYILF